MNAAVSLFLSWVAAAPVAVSGDTTCPAPAELAKALQEVLRADVTITERVRLSQGVGTMVVEVRDRSGATLMVRELEATGSCAEQARVAAVVVGVWLEQVHPNVLLDIYWPIDGPPKPVPPEEPVVREPAPPPRLERSWAFDVGAGLAASLAQGDATLGAMVQANGVPAGSGLGVHVDVGADLSRSTLLGNNGRVSWNRVPLGVGPLFRLARGTYALDLRLALAGGWLFYRGEDLPAGYQAVESTRWTWGTGAGLRITTRDGPLLKWLDLGGFYWGRAQVGEAELIGEARMPRVQAMLTLGASWCPWCSARPGP